MTWIGWHSAPLSRGVLALLLALIAGEAEARTFVLRADGSGDVPTFQAGVDSLRSRLDTLSVLPGHYEEDVVGTGEMTIVCPSGPELTRLTSLRLRGSYDGLEVHGLQVAHALAEGGSIRFENCWFSESSRFVADSKCELTRCRFTGTTEFPYMGRILNSEFQGDVRFFSDSGIVVDSCLFVHARVHCSPRGGGSTWLQHSTFTGSSVRVGGTPATTIRGCSFANADSAIVVLHEVIYATLRVFDCNFENILGPAILGVDFGFAVIEVADSKFMRCGSALRLQGSGRPNARLHRSTMRSMASDGVVIDVTRVAAILDSLVIEDCGGDGLRIQAPESSYEGDLECVGSVFRGNHGDGLSLRLGGAWNDSAKVLSCVAEANGANGITVQLGSGSGLLAGNTSVRNAGTGIAATLTSAVGAIAIERNLVVGNDGGGVAGEGRQDSLRAAFNDAWMNEGDAYAGVRHVGDNLTVDPQFCDPLAGDYRVASSSPCAPSGPHGQIGAFGVGCEFMSVPVDVQPRGGQAINLHSNAHVEAAILAHRLFDPQRVDPATVRLAGAPPSPRGKTSSQMRDVNQDGIADLLLTFNVRDLNLADDVAVLEGHTFDGVSFRGSDAVELRGASQTSLEEGSESPTRLAIVPIRALGRLTLLVELPTPSPATVEMFDVAGRRVLSRDLFELGPGRHRLELQEGLAPGLYLVRLRQGPKTVGAKAVLLQ